MHYLNIIPVSDIYMATQILLQSIPFFLLSHFADQPHLDCSLAHTFQDELPRYFLSAIRIIITSVKILLLNLYFIEKKMSYMETKVICHLSFKC